MALLGHVGVQASDWLSLLFGRRDNLMVALFRACFDEAGTGGRSPYSIVSGPVARLDQWDAFDRSWDELLNRNGVRYFHSKEFHDRNDDFDGWSNFKCKRFSDALAKRIKQKTALEVMVAVEDAVHARFKKELRGVKGFKTDSDVGLAFRIAMFLTCLNVESIDRSAKVAFVVETGPYSNDANVIYEDIEKTGGHPWKPARYAHMLGGFASLPKGQLRGLEAADYLADRSLKDIEDNLRTPRPKLVYAIANEKFLEEWYHGVLRERVRRTEHGRRKPKANPFSSEEG